MDVQLTEIQHDLIKGIAHNEGFIDFDLTAKPATIKGDNYIGVITAVTIKNGEKRLDLILKSASPNEKVRETVPLRNVFLREIYMYEKTFTEFAKFQKEQELVNGFSAYARIYGSCDEEPNECLVFENLREEGYKLWNRRVPMNSDHVAFVFTEYGKLHAVSLAVRDKKPELYEKLAKNLVNLFETDDDAKREEYMAPVLGSGFKAVEDNPVASEVFERFAIEIKKSIKESQMVKEDKLVVTHGDCWCNNLMFKYEVHRCTYGDLEDVIASNMYYKAMSVTAQFLQDPQDSTKPTDLRILDWQISSTGSPVMDLAYFFFVCSPKEILLDYRKYLKIYHDSVCRSLKGLQCDPETVFPYSLLEYHWKKYAKYGLYIALMLIKLMLGDVEEVPDMTEIAESGKSFADGFNFDTVHNSDYNQRITDIVLMMAENDLI